jgi:hypothetical protein
VNGSRSADEVKQPNHAWESLSAAHLYRQEFGNGATREDRGRFRPMHSVRSYIPGPDVRREGGSYCELFRLECVHEPKNQLLPLARGVRLSYQTTMLLS